VTIRRICVFCGSRVGARPSYITHARALGDAIARRGMGVVYGGASVGLMGALADSAIAANGEVIGVIPDALVAREVAHRSLTQQFVVRTMHERKAKMAELADAFIALPGGFGTLEELFEMTTWAMLGIHRKPIGLLDAAGYFRALLAFVEQSTREGFVDPAHAALLLVRDTPASLLDALVENEPKLPEIEPVMAKDEG
jgi:uncharacterized protein (TIGR00730 family)